MSTVTTINSLSDAIDLQNLNYIFQGSSLPVLSIPARQVARNERVFLQGESGSGKSMLLGLLAGLYLGLPRSLIFRHPFPGPGLGVRILGEIKPSYADVLREADAIFIQELRAADLYDQVSQAFAVYLPVKSVGVVGDARRYEHVIALRAVETIDFMTARWAHLPYEFIERVSNRIINEISGVSRVVYDVSSKPPATIEWE